MMYKLIGKRKSLRLSSCERRRWTSMYSIVSRRISPSTSVISRSSSPPRFSVMYLRPLLVLYLLIVLVWRQYWLSFRTSYVPSCCLSLNLISNSITSPRKISSSSHRQRTLFPSSVASTHSYLLWMTLTPKANLNHRRSLKTFRCRVTPQKTRKEQKHRWWVDSNGLTSFIMVGKFSARDGATLHTLLSAMQVSQVLTGCNAPSQKQLQA